MHASSSINTVIPKFLLLMLLILSTLPIGISGASPVFPMLEAISIIYWCIYRPRALPYWFVFLFGLCWDAIYGWPLGVTALGCVMLRFIVVFYREYFTTHMFSMLWRGVTLLLLIFAAYKWIALSLLYDELLPKQTILLQWMMSAAAYPLLHGFFNFLCIGLPERYGDA